jgi:uncharacterized membrane protein (DUF373 family)
MGRRHRTVEHYRKIPNPIRRQSLRALDALDLAIYVLVGISFVLAAVMALAFSVVNLAHYFGLPAQVLDFGNFGETVLTFISDLLLILIILEVLGTVRSYLEHGDTSVKPFIFIGMISGTRGLLSIGARLSLAGITVGDTEFRNSMIELGVNAAIVIALGATLRIMGDTARADEEEAGAETARAEKPGEESASDGLLDRVPAAIATTLPAHPSEGGQR